MKKLNYALLVLLLFLVETSYSQQSTTTRLQRDVDQRQSQFDNIDKTNIHIKETVTRQIPVDLTGVLLKASFLEIDPLLMREALSSRSEVISLTIPHPSREDITLDLIRSNFLTSDFTIRVSSDENNPIKMNDQSHHYWGTIRGERNSFAAITLTDDEISGTFSSSSIGNCVIGKMEDGSSRHVVYAENDLLATYPDCETDDSNPLPYAPEQLQTPVNTKALDNCVRIYVEVDKTIYDDKGSISAVTSYITGLFNQVAALYANEDITYVMSEMYIWDTADPYSGPSSGNFLGQFQNHRNSFNGDLAALVGFGGGGGIAAGFSGLCNSNIDNSMSFSGISSTYSNVPVYSWSVQVLTHELGHLMGSRHTHACVWNGNNTAIDGCSGFTEGGCTIPPNPTGGGTIMSYCHITSAGINFNNGFGTQPGNVIRNNVINGACLTSCDGDDGGDDDDSSYCASLGSNTSYEWIESVSIGNLNNVSGNNNGYSDFTAQTLNVVSGEDVSLALTPGFGSSAYNEVWNVWIDYNQDYTFTSNELVYTGSGNGVVTGNFTVPATATLGNTQMRVSMKYNSGAAPCETFTYGEVEDYSVNIATSEPIVICESSGTNTSYEYINSVVIGDINNTSNDDNGYGDYLSLSTSASAGDVVNLQLTPGFVSSAYTENWKVWVDYNNDGDFDDAGEEVYSGSSNATVSGSFTIPANASSGAHAMRVSMKYGSFPEACETFTYGEVEDYTLVVGNNSSQNISFVMNGKTTPSQDLYTRLDVYPIPSKGRLFVQFHSIPDGNAEITVIDLTGKRVFNESFSDLQDNSNLSLPLHNLVNGTYIMEISSVNDKQNVKFVINK